MTFTCIAKCGTCGAVINTAHGVPEEAKGQVAMSAPLVSFCENRSHNSLSDVNWNLKLEWIEEHQPLVGTVIEPPRGDVPGVGSRDSSKAVEGPTPDEAIGEEEAEAEQERRHEQPVLGCDCHECIK